MDIPDQKKKCAKLATKLIIFLCGNNTVTFSVISCLKQKSFLSLKEKNYLYHYWIKTICILFSTNLQLILESQSIETRMNSKLNKVTFHQKVSGPEAGSTMKVMHLFGLISDFGYVFFFFFLEERSTQEGRLHGYIDHDLQFFQVQGSTGRLSPWSEALWGMWGIINALPLGTGREGRPRGCKRNRSRTVGFGQGPRSPLNPKDSHLEGCLEVTLKAQVEPVYFTKVRDLFLTEWNSPSIFLSY